MTNPISDIYDLTGIKLTPEIRTLETIGILVQPHSNTSGVLPVKSSIFFTGLIPGGSLRITFLLRTSATFSILSTSPNY